MARKLLLITKLFLIINYQMVFSQGIPPWERPLKIATSTDGQNFFNSNIFQDSSGVPSMIKWKGDTLLCVFQWFRLPMNSITWDKVAVKFSYDSGNSWTQPVPIVVNGLPSNYQRPFDPTISIMSTDSLRIFFSSSNGMPPPGGDSIIDSYSAVSTDGINYTFEPGARYDNAALRVIDPAANIFQGQWHYLAPIGAPQDGAYHCISSDGINYVRQNDDLSDAQHNWTGNFVVNDTNELRFYGSGQFLWYNSTSDAFNWNGYVNTNIIGGDPTVAKLTSTNYIMVYTGQPYTTSVEELENEILFYPNPVIDKLNFIDSSESHNDYMLYNSLGELIQKGSHLSTLQVANLSPGKYLLVVKKAGQLRKLSFVKS